VTVSGDAFSGDPWTCTVRNLVDPVGEGVSIAFDLRYDGELEVVEETANSITVLVPYPDEVGGGISGMFEWADCFVMLTDSAGCSVELSSAQSVAWFDPRADAGIALTVRTDSSIGEPYRYVSPSWDVPPTAGWGYPTFDWYRNGLLVESGYTGTLTDIETGDEVRAVIRHVRDDGLELRGEDTIVVRATDG
jgi:hypothetical protein